MKKYLTRILAAILGAAIVLLPLLPRAEAEEYSYAKALYYNFGGDGAYELTFFTPDGEVCRLPCGPDGFYIDLALDRAYAFVITEYDESSGGVLHYVDENGAREIARGVYYCFSSDTGGSGAYFTDCPDHADFGRLWHYDGKTGKSVCVEEKASFYLLGPWNNGAALSPDGRSLAYRRDNGAGGWEGVVWNRGRIIELGDGASPVAVADNAKYIYYGQFQPPSDIQEGVGLLRGAFYLRSGKSTELIAEAPSYMLFDFNRDFSEAWCIVNGGDSYVMCVDGEVVGAAPEFWLYTISSPEYGLAGETYDSNFVPFLEGYDRYGVDSFSDKLVRSIFHIDDVQTGFQPYYINSDYSAVRLAEKGGLRFSSDGSAATYAYDGKLYFIPDTATYSEGGEQLVSQYYASYTYTADMSEIYYINTSSELWLWRDGGRVKLADNARLISLSNNMSGGWFGNRGTAQHYSYLPPVDGLCYYRDKETGAVCAVDRHGARTEILSWMNNPYALLFGGEILVFDYNYDAATTDVYRLDGTAATLIVEDMLY